MRGLGGWNWQRGVGYCGEEGGCGWVRISTTKESAVFRNEGSLENVWKAGFAVVHISYRGSAAMYDETAGGHARKRRRVECFRSPNRREAK